jgi:hypothetical protein
LKRGVARVPDPSIRSDFDRTERAMTAISLLIFCLPFLLALAGQGSMPKMLCFVTSLLAMLLSVKPFGAVLPWSFGMIIAVISVWERLDRCRQLAWVCSRAARNSRRSSSSE